MTFVRSYQYQKSAEAVILGGGIAASATAVALLSAGIRPRLLVRGHRGIGMAEAIPASAVQLFEALDLGNLIHQSTILSRGLDNRWNPKTPVFRDEPYLLFDRSVLAERMLGEARHRGAIVEELAGLPSLNASRDGVVVAIAGESTGVRHRD